MRTLALLLVLSGCAAAIDPVDLRARLTDDYIARLAVPLILVQVPQRGLVATLVPTGQNGTVRSWRSRDAVQLSYDQGVLVATRGLGHDLMSADVAGTVAALRGRSGQYDRASSVVDGAFRTVVTHWTCAMSRHGGLSHDAPTGPVAVTVFVETCTGPTTIENRYHVGADGVLWWSRQWASTEVGVLETERMKR